MSYSFAHPIYQQIGTGRIFDINNTNYRNAMLPVSNSGSFQFDSWTMGSEKRSNYPCGYSSRSFYIRNQPKQLQNHVSTLRPLPSPEIWSQASKSSQNDGENESPVPSFKEKRTPGIDRNSHPEEENSSKTTRFPKAASHSRQINDNSVESESPKQRNKSKTPIRSQKADPLPTNKYETPLSTKQKGKSPSSSKARAAKENQIKKTRSPHQNHSPVEKETATPPNQGKRITPSNQSASGILSTPPTNRSPLPPTQTERMVQSNRSSPPNSKVRSPRAQLPIPCNQIKSPTPASKQSPTPASKPSPTPASKPAGMSTPKSSYPAQGPLLPTPRHNDTEGHGDLKGIPADNGRLSNSMTGNEYEKASPPTKTVLSPHAENVTPSPSTIQTEKHTTSHQVECSQTPVQAKRPILVSPGLSGDTRPTTFDLSGNRMAGRHMSYYQPEMLFPPELVDDPILPFLQAGRLLPLTPCDDSKHCASVIRAERYDKDNIMAYNQTTCTTSPQYNNRAGRLPPRYIEMNNNDGPKAIVLPAKRSQSPTVVNMAKPLPQVGAVMVPNQSVSFGLFGQREQPVEYTVVQKSRYFDAEYVSYKKIPPPSVKPPTRPLTTDSPERTQAAASKEEDPKRINENVRRIIEQYRTCYELLSLEKKSSNCNLRSCSTDQRKLTVPGDKTRNTSVNNMDLYGVKSQTQERYNCNTNISSTQKVQVQGGQPGAGDPHNDNALPPSQCIQTNNNGGPATAHTLTPGAYQNDAPSASQNVQVLNQTNRQDTYYMDANGNSLYYNVPPPRISPPSVSEGATSNGFQQRRSRLDDVDVWVPPDVEAPLDGYRPINLKETKTDEVKDRPRFLTSGWNSVGDKWQQRPVSGPFAPPGCMASDYLPLYRHCLPPLADDLPPLDGTDYDPGQEEEMDEDDGVTGEGCHDVFTSYFGDNREDKIRALSRVEIARVVVCV